METRNLLIILIAFSLTISLSIESSEAQQNIITGNLFLESNLESGWLTKLTDSGFVKGDMFILSLKAKSANINLDDENSITTLLIRKKGDSNWLYFSTSDTNTKITSNYLNDPTFLDSEFPFKRTIEFSRDNNLINENSIENFGSIYEIKTQFENNQGIKYESDSIDLKINDKRCIRHKPSIFIEILPSNDYTIEANNDELSIDSNLVNNQHPLKIKFNSQASTQTNVNYKLQIQNNDGYYCGSSNFIVKDSSSTFESGFIQTNSKYTFKSISLPTLISNPLIIFQVLNEKTKRESNSIFNDKIIILSKDTPICNIEDPILTLTPTNTINGKPDFNALTEDKKSYLLKVENKDNGNCEKRNIRIDKFEIEAFQSSISEFDTNNWIIDTPNGFYTSKNRQSSEGKYVTTYESNNKLEFSLEPIEINNCVDCESSSIIYITSKRFTTPLVSDTIFTINIYSDKQKSSSSYVIVSGTNILNKIDVFRKDLGDKETNDKIEFEGELHLDIPNFKDIFVTLLDSNNVELKSQNVKTSVLNGKFEGEFNLDNIPYKKDTLKLVTSYSNSNINLVDFLTFNINPYSETRTDSNEPSTETSTPEDSTTETSTPEDSTTETSTPEDSTTETSTQSNTKSIEYINGKPNNGNVGDIVEIKWKLNNIPLTDKQSYNRLVCSNPTAPSLQNSNRDQYEAAIYSKSGNYVEHLQHSELFREIESNGKNTIYTTNLELKEVGDYRCIIIILEDDSIISKLFYPIFGNIFVIKSN